MNDKDIKRDIDLIVDWIALVVLGTILYFNIKDDYLEEIQAIKDFIKYHLYNIAIISITLIVGIGTLNFIKDLIYKLYTKENKK